MVIWNIKGYYIYVDFYYIIGNNSGVVVVYIDDEFCVLVVIECKEKLFFCVLLILN